VKKIERLFSLLASKKLTLWLILFFCISLVPGSLAESGFHLSAISGLFLAAFSLNLALCTFRRIRSLSKPVLIIHAGILLIIAAGVISSYGFIATKNIYEGDRVDSVYRWDAEREMPLGLSLYVKKINIEYYPVPLRIGVLKGGEKFGLFEIRTGDSFRVGQYTVKAQSFEYPAESANLVVSLGDRTVGSANTDGGKDLPEDFPYEFRLVASKKPHAKMTGIDVEISRNSEVIARGTLENNSPLTCESLSFYNVEVSIDKYGNRFAGVQITKDPGRPYVFLGFAVLGIGSLLWGYNKVRGYR
jgi:hypothetical protein